MEKDKHLIVEDKKRETKTLYELAKDFVVAMYQLDKQIKK